jgi:hypothetical protein
MAYSDESNEAGHYYYLGCIQTNPDVRSHLLALSRRGNPQYLGEECILTVKAVSTAAANH